MAGAGDPNKARLFVLLLLITVYMRLVFFRRRNRFQQRLRLLALRGRRRVMEAYFYHPRRKICRRRKGAWVLERPQFWFENMVLNQHADNIWQEHQFPNLETDLPVCLQFGWTAFSSTRQKFCGRNACCISDLTALSDK